MGWGEAEEAKKSTESIDEGNYFHSRHGVKKIRGVFVNIFVPICIKLSGITKEMNFSPPILILPLQPRRSALYSPLRHSSKIDIYFYHVSELKNGCGFVGWLMIHLTMKSMSPSGKFPILLSEGEPSPFYLGTGRNEKDIIKLCISTLFDH